MEKQMAGGAQNVPTVYDYRLYDQIWRRVSPELNPYPEVRATQAPPAIPQRPSLSQELTPEAEEPTKTVPHPVNIPGQAATILERFLEEELAQSEQCLALSSRVSLPSAARLFSRAAVEKRRAATQLRTACFLLSGHRPAPCVTARSHHWHCLADALRAFFHQESRGGTRYRQAAEATEDACLRQLLAELGRESFHRAKDTMDLLERLLR